MNTSISKDLAWEIAREFSDMAKQEDIDDSILGIFVIGSLGADNYIPGQSDIDTAIVTRDSISDVLRAMIMGNPYRFSFQIWDSKRLWGGYIARE